jgi:hypothetical protein
LTFKDAMRPRTLLLFLSLVVFGPSHATARSKCADTLARLDSAIERRTIGSVTIAAETFDWQQIGAITASMKDVTNAVVYVPIAAEGGITTLRIAHEAGGVQMAVVARSTLTLEQFEKRVRLAQETSAEPMREQLRRSLVPADVRDQGRTIFVRDLNYHGLLPRSLGIRDGVMLSTTSVPQALANLRRLQQSQPNAQIAGLIAFPRTRAEFERTFDKNPRSTPDVWRKMHDDAVSIAHENGVQLPSSNGGLTRAELQRALENADGIIFVLAHAEGCHIKLPNGTEAVISPEDVARLKLKKHPFVVLRICQGEDNGFADSFMEAGASCVWANRGTIYASESNRQLEMFLKAVRAGDSIVKAIQKARDASRAAEVSTGIYADLSMGIQGGRPNDRQCSDGTTAFGDERRRVAVAAWPHDASVDRLTY